MSNERERDLALALLARWAGDPVAFAYEALGFKYVWSKQRWMLEQVVKSDRVAVRSGHKVGKSTSAAILALWWVATRAQGRVVMTSSGYRQVEDILWRELRRLVREAPRPLGGKLSLDPSTGLKFKDGREIIGLTAAEPEKIAGYSGAELLFILDEASGIPDEIFEAIEGNRASDGTKIVMFSNPTRTSGTFYDAFHTKRKFWSLIHISSEDSPNVTGEAKVPGLAGPNWVAEKKEEWAGTPAIYAVRVRGDFPTQGTNSIITLHMLEMAINGWHNAPQEGVLNIGVDVARYGDDESVIRGRRGVKALEEKILAQLSTVQLAEQVVEYARTHARNGEKPVIKIDVIGVGAGVVDHLEAYYGDEFVICPVNVAESPDDEKYALLRDQLWFGLAQWFLKGGTYEANDKLDQELVAPVYTINARGKYVVSSKADIKKLIKRSPDRADALALAVYEPQHQARPVILFS